MDRVVFGDGVNYVPNGTDTDIHGNQVWESAPAVPAVLNANIIRYSVLADKSVGDFQFGEVGFFVGPTLVALAANDTLISKVATTTGQDGNFMRLDAFLSMVGQNYEMWLDVASSDNLFRMASVESVDHLLPTADAVPNAYIIGSASPNAEAFLAYTNRDGLWVFDQYKYSSTIDHRFTVVEATPFSVTIADASLAYGLNPLVFGDRVLQFATGALYSICRNVLEVIPDLVNDQVVLTFETPIAVLPVPGDEFLVYNRDPLATSTVTVPPATTTSLGVVQIGPGVDVDIYGVISVNRATVPGGLVWSIGGRDGSGNPIRKQGDVDLTARDVGAVATINGQPPDPAGNINITSYTLPIASSTVLGGVRVSSGSGLQINPANGQLSVQSFGTLVQSVNGRTGPAVTVRGVLDPLAMTSGANLNDFTAWGIFYGDEVVAASLTSSPTFPDGLKPFTLEIVPMHNAAQGAVLQRWTQQDGTAWRLYDGANFSSWFDPIVAGMPIASAVRVGVVSIGNGLGITLAGQLSANISSVGLNLPGSLLTGGAAITNSGNIAVGLANAPGNAVWAGPNGTAGAPSYRALTAADVPEVDGGTY